VLSVAYSPDGGGSVLSTALVVLAHSMNLFDLLRRSSNPIYKTSLWSGELMMFFKLGPTGPHYESHSM